MLIAQQKLIVNDLISPASDSENERPCCQHGPALKFCRRKKSGDEESRCFYSCAGVRDRKICPLFVWEDDHKKKRKRKRLEEDQHAGEPSTEQKKTTGLASLQPLTNDRGNAQYLFSNDSLAVIASMLIQWRNVLRKGDSKLRVLCVGMPSLHEYLQSNDNCNANSYLLDMDARLKTAVGQNGASCSQYNMMNNYFFSEDDERAARAFISKGVDAVLLDPPFHSDLLPAIALSFSKLFATSSIFDQNNVFFALFFPIFFQESVTNAFPGLTALDYRVCYSNHPNYRKSDNTPVRLFVNDSSRRCFRTLPAELVQSKAYRRCEQCDQVVFHRNVHCAECNRCTTVTGKTPYMHCHNCGVCVKGEHDCIKASKHKKGRS